MRRTVIILAIISILLLSSCYYIWPVYPEEEQPAPLQYAQVRSSSLFVYNGRVCIACNAVLPAEIYNPNSHVIVLTVDGTDYIVAPLTSFPLEADNE